MVRGMVVSRLVSVSTAVSPVGPDFNPKSVSSVSLVSGVWYIKVVMSLARLSA